MFSKSKYIRNVNLYILRPISPLKYLSYQVYVTQVNKAAIITTICIVIKYKRILPDYREIDQAMISKGRPYYLKGPHNRNSNNTQLFLHTRQNKNYVISFSIIHDRPSTKRKYD